MITTTARHLLVPTTVGTMLLIVACASPPTEEGTSIPARVPTPQAASVTITDPWVKAANADDEMTAAFGILVNEGEEDVTVVAARADEVSDVVELHEVGTGDDGNTAMREKGGGFSVGAGSEHELSPGADHIMLMDPTEALEPGTEVTITLEFEDGTTQRFTAPVKDFEGANEDYDAGHEGDHGRGHEEH